MDSDTNTVNTLEASVIRSWVDVRDETALAPVPTQSLQQQHDVEKKELACESNEVQKSSFQKDDLLSSPSFIETGGDDVHLASSLSSLLVERIPGNNHNDELCLSSPLSNTEQVHSDSSGESFDVTDAFDISHGRTSVDLMSRSKGPSNTASPTSSVRQLSEDEDPIENARRGRSASMSSRKRRGQGHFATPSISSSTATSLVSSSSRDALAQITASALACSSELPLSVSTPSFYSAPPPPAAAAAGLSSSSLSSSSASSSSSSSSSRASSEETGSYSQNSVIPSTVLPPQFLPLLQAINARAVSMSLVSFLAGMLVAYWWLKRQASVKKTDRLQTEATLRQMLALKEAEVNRLSNLFEKYLSRPLLLRYLPNRF